MHNNYPVTFKSIVRQVVVSSFSLPIIAFLQFHSLLFLNLVSHFVNCQCYSTRITYNNSNLFSTQYYQYETFWTRIFQYSILKMQRAMVKCNEVQTQVVTEGRWIEEGLAPNGNKHVVVVIPGNPGIPDFYTGFIKALNSRLPSETPVWLVGHAGHVQPSSELAIAMPPISRFDEYYNLKAQIQHKKDFIKKYVPDDAKLHIVGHSIGSWITLNLLDDEDIAKRVVKCYMLFPTIERMAQSRNGHYFVNTVSRFASLLIFLSWILSFFPLILQEIMVRGIGILYGFPSKTTKAILQLLNPYVLERAIMLGREEMNIVKERDDKILCKYSEKLWFYYGATDGWTPVSYYNDMKAKHPDIEAELCKRGFRHSFVLQHDEQMGTIVGDLINENIANA